MGSPLSVLIDRVEAAPVHLAPRVTDVGGWALPPSPSPRDRAALLNRRLRTWPAWAIYAVEAGRCSARVEQLQTSIAAFDRSGAPAPVRRAYCAAFGDDVRKWERWRDDYHRRAVAAWGAR